ncbi:MAG: GMP synthase [Sulfolobales archaeon]|nr:GMP synthase [Sulfolobales archaeon]MCX8185955.1 GMP synthase [Sulfolobales archaeon]MDW7969212.1 GMP synthase [Sulfolobales archaeon]
MWDPKAFVDKSINDLKIKYGDINRVLAAVSGGVDSTTATLITYRALGDKVIPIFIDTGFMRFNEGFRVREMLRDLIPLEVVDMSETFYERIEGLSDAEVKRKAFREVFYKVVSEIANGFGCEYVVQGTIAPDWIETLGGIKTQHNVLSDEFLKRYGFKVIEPLRELYKDQVRAVAKYLGVPNSIIYRQPFPGPGLLVRTVGLFTREKLSIVRDATEIVEKFLQNYSISQYFPAVWEYEISDEGKVCEEVCINYKVFRIKATGVKGDSRVYEPVVLVDDLGGLSPYAVYKYFNNKASHIVWQVVDRGLGKYFISIRAVVTEDFMTADVFNLSRKVLEDLAEELIKINGVRAVGYDVTPKPPATIEYE